LGDYALFTTAVQTVPSLRTQMTDAFPRTASFRFFGNVCDFLPPGNGGDLHVHRFRGTPSVKDRIETLGPPHTEVAYIRIDGLFRDFSQRLSGSENIEVYGADARLPVVPPGRALNSPPKGEPRFVADVNLGRLARLLRLMGFDTLYRNDYEDAGLARIAVAQTRILLTRDRRLLMRRELRYGYFVRDDDPPRQAEEVLRRYALADLTRPFHRCSRCNGLVHPVAKTQVLELLEPKTRRYYDRFWQCDDCGQVYWEGSHMHGLHRLVNRLSVG